MALDICGTEHEMATKKRHTIELKNELLTAERNCQQYHNTYATAAGKLDTTGGGAGSKLVCRNLE